MLQVHCSLLLLPEDDGYDECAESNDVVAITVKKPFQHVFLMIIANVRLV